MVPKQYQALSLAVALGATSVVVASCSDDESTATDVPTTTGDGGWGGTTTSVSGGAGGGGGSTATSSAGGAGGEISAGGAGGESVGFPWEDALDPNGSASSTRLTARPASSTEAPQGFYEYLPSGYPGPTGTKWPLLVFTHGIGENGDGEAQLDDVLSSGIPRLIHDDAWAVDRPYVVLMPQHPGDGCPGAAEIHAMIDWGMSSYEIDPRYVYLTGLSCGAIGAWNYLAAHLDEQIAAMVPIAGDGQGAWTAQGCELGRVAIWAFHGDADGTVDVAGTNVPMDGLAACPAPPAKENKKTIYSGVGHDSWTMTYDLSAGHDIYSWLLGFTHEP